MSYDDLVRRLREYRPRNEWGDGVHHVICDESADAIVDLQRQLAEAVAKEREACARIADPPFMHRKGAPGLWRRRRAAIAAAIRDRGNG